MRHINVAEHRGSNFGVYPGGAAGTLLLCIHQLGQPSSKESETALHPKSGKSPYRGVENTFYEVLSISAQRLFIPHSFPEWSL